MSDSAGPVMLPARMPFRLDLTVAVLRRLSTNCVDLLDERGHYLRAISTAEGSAILDVSQPEPAAQPLLAVHLAGDPREWIPTAARMLGCGADVRGFYRRARSEPWLNGLARRMLGVKPPRYPTLWETVVNAIVFQQVSIIAAAAILRRVIESLADPVFHEGRPLFPFPRAERLLEARPQGLRDAGLSAAKLTALRSAAEELTGDRLREEDLEALPTPQAAERLQAMRGVGPWTAAVILLRGFGRLDVFPTNDSGVAQSIRAAADDPSATADAVLEKLGPYRGFLYYHLLLARLERAGSLGAS